MYLYDRVAQSVTEALVEDQSGRRHRVPGAADLAADVRNCTTRYVLDSTIRDTCLELLCNRPEVIRLEDECYRIPHRALWIEWTDPQVAAASSAASQRAGILILSDETGRRGTMQSFSTEADGKPWIAQIFFAFDFDTVISAEDALCGVEFGDVRDPAEVNRLFRHCLGQIDRRWLNFFRDSGGLPPGALQAMMRGALPDFGMLCAFLLLLSLECAATEPRRGLDRINRARARSGRALLLDHVEVSLRLAAVASGEGVAHGDRSGPRLHQVRGHLVRRSGKTFWRTHHLRGDAGLGIVASRTVRVTGNREALRQGTG